MHRQGKAAAPYEFGVKTSIVTNNRLAPGSLLHVHAKAMPDNPYTTPWGGRHAKLTSACGCKSHPAKAAAGEPGPSLAGVAATRGLKM